MQLWICLQVWTSSNWDSDAHVPLLPDQVSTVTTTKDELPCSPCAFRLSTVLTDQLWWAWAAALNLWSARCIWSHIRCLKAAGASRLFCFDWKVLDRDAVPEGWVRQMDQCQGAGLAQHYEVMVSSENQWPATKRNTDNRQSADKVHLICSAYILLPVYTGTTRRCIQVGK